MKSTYNFVSFDFRNDYSFPGITVQPTSASVPLGETALFMCAGDALASFWTVNGNSDSVPASIERGVEVSEDDSDPSLVRTNLTIPATVENDNVSIQCALVVGLIVEFSSVVYLTVLGKSHVLARVKIYDTWLITDSNFSQ